MRTDVVSSIAERNRPSQTAREETYAKRRNRVSAALREESAAARSDVLNPQSAEGLKQLAARDWGAEQ